MSSSFHLSPRWLAMGVAAFLACEAAGAATLVGADGTQFRVEATSRIAVPLFMSGAAHSGYIGGGLGYEVRSADGRHWAGVIQGTDESLGRLTATLAQNPITRETVLVFASPDDASYPEVSFAFWQGQGWSEPRPLTSRIGRADRPVLAFLPQGNAVLAWESLEGHATQLLRHFEFSAAGEVQLYSFLDIGPASNLLQPVGAPQNLAANLAHLAVDGARSQAYVFLREPVTSSVSVAQVRLTRSGEPGGFGAPPVPATLTMGLVTATADGISPAQGGVVEGREADGMLFAPFHAQVLEADGFYWFTPESTRLVLFRSDDRSSVIDLPLSATEEQAHFDVLRAIRREVARDLRIGAGVLPACGSGARRSN